MPSRPGPRPLPPVFPDQAARRLVLALTALDDQLEALRSTTDRSFADACPGFEGQVRAEVEAGCVRTQEQLGDLHATINDHLDALGAAQLAAVRARDVHDRALHRWERDLGRWQDARRNA